MFTKDNETYQKDINALLAKMDDTQLDLVYRVVSHMVKEEDKQC